MFGYIYKTTNIINEKIYIGQHHGEFNPYYKGSGKLIIYALQKYRPENFKVEILCECFSDNDLNEKEKYWISVLNSRNPNVGYNILEGGISSPNYRKQSHRKGKHLSKETCKKMSISHLGRKNSEDHNKHIGDAKRGTHCSEHTKQLLRESLKKHSGSIGTMWIKNEYTKESLKLQKELAISYLNNGWIPGRFRTWKNQYEL